MLKQSFHIELDTHLEAFFFFEGTHISKLVEQTIAQFTKSKYITKDDENEIDHTKSLMLTTEKFTLRGAKRELLSTKTFGTSIDTKNWLKLRLRKQAL